MHWRIQFFADLPGCRPFCSRRLPVCSIDLAGSRRPAVGIRLGGSAILRVGDRMPCFACISRYRFFSTPAGELSSIAGNDKAGTRQAKIERPATGYGSILSAISNLPSLTVTTNPGFDAFRCVSNEIRPVTPSKSAVFANASRTAVVSIVPAR